MSRSLLLFCGSAVLLCGCVSPKYTAPAPKTTDYAHLYVKGSWGSDSDIWVLPDDTFGVARLHARSQRIEEQYTGYRRGLFRSLTNFVGKQDAWKITTQTLKSDLETARNREGIAVGVMDDNHYFIQLRFRGQSLIADAYAPGAYADSFPAAHRLRAFAIITNMILAGTIKR